MHKLNRRTFLQTAAGVAATPSLQSSTPTRSTSAAPLLQIFPYGSVQLLDGPLKRQFDENHEFYFNLSEDRLLKIYRKRAGLPAPGEDMGGWYDDFCPGAHFGQYVSALARFAAATNSEPTRAKVERLVTGYSATLDPSGKIFRDLRYPAYTYDKINCMLIDAYSWAGERRASSILRETTRCARPHMPEKALTQEEKLQRPHKDETYTWDESYTLAENLFLASERFGDDEYFQMAQRYLLDKTFFDPLSQGHNVLPGLHAYSHVNALSSGMQGYLKLHDPKYFRAVSNAVDMIWNDQSFATGGWGPNEGFVQPGSGALGASLNETHRSFETPCGAYAHFKLMRYLISLTCDPKYGDSMERVLYNTVLGAKRVREDGSSFYYSDYHDSGFKTNKRVIADSKYPWDHDGRWPCCSGTLPQVVADYTISAYFRSKDGVYVNLYVPSQLRSQVGNTFCSLRQTTTYPTGNLIDIGVTVSAPAEFSIYLRIPEWAGNNTSISLNGRRSTNPVRPGTFHRIQREWETNDSIQLELDQPTATVPVDSQTPERVAIVRGPQVLFGMTEVPKTMARNSVSRSKVVNISGDAWSLQLENESVPLLPFWKIGDESYQTYWHLAS